MKPTTLTYLLYHEAAHARIAAHFFGPSIVKSIAFGVLRANGGKPANGLATFTKSVPMLHLLNPVGSACVHLAGHEAEKMLGVGTGWDPCSDLEAAADACELIARRTGKAADYRAIVSETRRLLVKYWAAIEALADALVRSDNSDLRGTALWRLLA
jgi:hypothetical protein